MGNITQTDFGYTGQRSLENGLMDYHARFYDAYLNRWNQPDTIVPNPSNPQGLNRYSYVLNNPIRYSDPTGHRNCKEDDCNCDGKKVTNPVRTGGANGSDDPRVYTYHLHSDDNLYQLGWGNVSSAWSIWKNPNASMLQRMGAGYYMSIWGGAHILLAIGAASLAVASFTEVAGGGAAACAADAGECENEVAQGFNKFDNLKEFIGSPGEGNVWHHIVEQSQITKSGFMPEEVHATDNVLAVDKTIHGFISGFYSSKPLFTDGLRVRDWLAGQSFEAQYNYGLQILKEFGVIH